VEISKYYLNEIDRKSAIYEIGAFTARLITLSIIISDSIHNFQKSESSNITSINILNSTNLIKEIILEV
jgi:hypothetical protein